jgi:N4-gp56 family major capsid protein
MANVANTDRLSLAFLDDAIVKMTTQSATRTFMKPASIQTKSGAIARKYVGLFHPRAIRDLKRDTDFRPFLTNNNKNEFDVISGSDFIGEYNGVLIYQLTPIDAETDVLRVAGAGASGIDIAHNLILGAEALAIGYGKVQKPLGNTKFNMEDGGRMMITTVDDDHGADALMASTAYMGFKKLVDNSSGTAEDNGKFSLFTAAVL